MDRRIQTICLPVPSKKRKSYRGKVATVAGWGHNLDFSKINPHLGPLYEVNVTVHSAQKCRKEGLRLNKNGEFCAGKEGKKDSCGGDSGGPMMIKENNKYYFNKECTMYNTYLSMNSDLLKLE